MQNDMMKMYTEMSEKAISSTNELIELNTRVLKEAIERQVCLGQVFAEGGQKQFELLQNTKDPKKLMEQQNLLTQQYSSIFLEAAKENVAIAQKVGEEYKTLLEENAQVVEKAVKKAASKK